MISDARATNYGVVRLGLIEHLFERMYDQKREFGPDEKTWPHRILARRSIVGLEESGNIKELPKLRIRPIEMTGTSHDELLEVDLVIVATGYRRDGHVEMLKDVWDLLPAHVSDEGARNDGDGWEVQYSDGTKRIMEVGRDYKVKFSEGKIAPGSGVFLQGCCEATHGVSGSRFFCFSSFRRNGNANSKSIYSSAIPCCQSLQSDRVRLSTPYSNRGDWASQVIYGISWGKQSCWISRVSDVCKFCIDMIFLSSSGVEKVIQLVRREKTNKKSWHFNTSTNLRDCLGIHIKLHGLQ